jgi:ribosomal protein S18 acetylase RimI-like enzyme
MSLYSEYISELRDLQIIEKDYGYITYNFQQDAVYIEELFIRKDFRHSGLGQELGSTVEQIAREKGMKKLLCTVIPTNKNSTYAIASYIKWGFKLDSSTNNFILLTKDIEVS